MQPAEPLIRAAAPEDAAKLLEIYRPYVETTAISFECETPPLSEFRARVERTLQKYPYIVAVLDGESAGCAYAGPFGGRAAYIHSAETSIYVKEAARGAGLGRRLYTTLEALLKAQNVLNIAACVACPERDDEYLTRNSVNFHTHMGWRAVGEFCKCGYKFGRWYNVAWLEKIIGKHAPQPAPFVPFPELSEDARRSAGLA